jgi:hypothetical protein
MNNGTGRKQLSEQLDRLDGMLDNLADGLNEAIASSVEKAVGHAVQEAVQAVMVELLTNPAFHQMKKSPIPEPSVPTPAKEPAPSRLSSWLSWTTSKVRAAARVCTAAAKQAAGLAKLAWQTASTSVKSVALAGVAAVAVTVCVARASIAAGLKVVFSFGKGLLAKAGNAFANVLPTMAFAT